MRDGLGRPLEWTGALPPAFERRVDRVLPEGARSAPAARARTACRDERARGVPRSGSCCALVAGALMGTLPDDATADARVRAAARAAIVCGCSRPAPVSRRSRFWAGSAGAGLFALLVLVALTGSVFVALVPSIAVGALPAWLLRPPAPAPDARGAGRVARRAARHRRVDRGRAFADAGGQLARRDRTACVADAFARFPELARVLGNGPGAGARQRRARRPDERPRARGADARARARWSDRPEHPRGPRRRDDARSQAARRARDRGPRDAHQRARRRRAAVVRARRADGAGRTLSRLLPVERRLRDAWSSPRA